jgi:murein DD-endopeptidase MepM/ murein hydrolase activator NlpD
MFAAHRWAVVLLGAMGALGAFACASGSANKALEAGKVEGTWRVVKEGETSASIAKEAGIPLEDFLEINGLKKTDALEAGRSVFVLGKSEGQAAGAVRGEGNAPLRWPVAMPRLSSPFGKRWGKDHEGIDMVAPIGTPVYAAAAGNVIYAGDQVHGYGNMVVVKHKDGLVTVYAHNSLLKVHVGDNVTTGQEIALVGDTGRATAPHLHFEVRRNEVPQDPMQFLPALK